MFFNFYIYIYIFYYTSRLIILINFDILLERSFPKKKEHFFFFRERESVPLISMDDLKPKGKGKEKCVDTRARSFLFSPVEGSLLSFPPDRSHPFSHPRSSVREEEKEDILEKPLTEFYDPSFEITENSMYFSSFSVSSVTPLFSLKETRRMGEQRKLSSRKLK